MCVCVLVGPRANRGRWGTASRGLPLVSFSTGQSDPLAKSCSQRKRFYGKNIIYEFVKSDGSLNDDFYGRNLRMFQNILECLSPESRSSLV